MIYRWITKFAMLPQLCLYTTWENSKTDKTARPWASCFTFDRTVVRNLRRKSSSIHRFQFLL